jgi:hypothetical protein
MNDELDRGLGRVEGTIERLTKAVDDLSSRVLGLEKKLYYYSGALALSLWVMANPDKVAAVFSAVAQASGR